MSSRKCCNTINLAKVSIEKLKRYQIPKPQKKYNFKIPPSPRVVKSPQILLCKPRPVEFKHPGAPCLCPPCPACPTTGERIRGAVYLSLKLLGVFVLGKVTIEKGLWGSPDLASIIVVQMSDLANKIAGDDSAGGKCVADQGACRLCIEEQFCSAGSSSAGLSSALDKIIKLWNFLVSSLFYSTIGLAASARQQAEAHIYYVLSGQAEKDREKAKEMEEEEREKALERAKEEEAAKSSAQKKKKIPQH